MFLKHPDNPPRPPAPPEHGHTFGAVAGRGVVGFCTVDGCTEFAVSTGKRWRDATGEEKLTVVARMMEDLCMVDAMTMVHRDRGYAVRRVAQARGYRSP